MKTNLSKLVLFFFIVILSQPIQAQNIDFSKESTFGNLFIRMYGEVHYYQPINTTQFSQGQFDAKRIVALFGYQFNRRTQFVTEWELEHANEIFLEQAFIKYQLKGKHSLKAGMILIPMGIVNENHEPNNYSSVDRPLVDRLLVPTTWRDIGIGMTGLLPASDLKYQVFLVNGLLGYQSGAAKFNAASNYRSGRQKGSKTVMSSLPALSAQLEYYGFAKGKIGLSVYSGKSNTDAYNGISREDKLLVASADSTTVYTNMFGLHAKFENNKWNTKAQLIFAHNSGVAAYNSKSNSDLGESALGAYIETGRSISKDNKWLAFIRYSYLDSKLGDATYNSLNHIITTGFNFIPTEGAIFKLDGQLSDIGENPTFQINAGIGVWF